MSADIRGKAAASARAGDLSPGEHLRAEIKRLALDQVAVSRATGVSRQSINNIINGRQPISRAMAGKLGRLTGHSSDYWLRESFPSTARARKSARASGAGILVNHQILRAVKDGIIVIEPFSTANMKAASIELSLDNIAITPGGDKVDIGSGKGFLLRAGRSITVSAKERIEMPRDHVGRLGALDRLVGAGIVTSHVFQIEPGFAGRLRFCLFNAGRSSFRLRAGEAVIGLEIMRLGATPSDRQIAT